MDELRHVRLRIHELRQNEIAKHDQAEYDREEKSHLPPAPLWMRFGRSASAVITVLTAARSCGPKYFAPKTAKIAFSPVAASSSRIVCQIDIKYLFKPADDHLPRDNHQRAKEDANKTSIRHADGIVK